MVNLMKNHRKIKRTFYLLAAVFIVTFLLRWAYEIYFSYNDVIINYNYAAVNFPYELESSGRVNNVASAKISQKDYSGQNITIDQKYEKTANISSSTTSFEEHNRSLRTAIDNSEAVIQMENLTGLSGAQSLTMTIGVMPERFDGLVEEIKTIGSLKSFTVNKVDKTSEFRSLMAQQETLKNTLESYLAIKEKGGNIQDLLLLEDKILEVERDLQNLGVDLGIYSSENSFCTVNFTLNETNRQEISLQFVFTCAKRSVFWTSAAYALGLFIVFAVLAATAALLALLGFIKKATAPDAEDGGKNEENP